MEILSLIALVLFSLLGYSIGVVIKAGKSVVAKPNVIDLLFISFIWIAAVLSGLLLLPNKWTAITLWLLVSTVIGYAAAWPRRFPQEKGVLTSAESQVHHMGLLQRGWRGWSQFARRLGAFQSRIWLSIFFFIFVTPLALISKGFSDPLHTKNSSGSSWLPKSENNGTLDQFRKQF